ncbi:MAG: hypothetical protein A2Z34_11580 [Planctomycetes bacterium RBG_16_59_8]|nr:MAG: hypothetical protein A2Z34_11580 [Planctomycetes bacterium RBG_16_59_8]
MLWTTSPFIVEIKGHARRIPNVRRQKCPSCGEEFFDEEANRVLDRYRGKRKRSAIVVGNGSALGNLEEAP